MYHLAIDVGSTSLKSAVADLDSHCLRHERVTPIPAAVCGNMTYELDAEELFQLVRERIEATISLCGSDLAGIRLSTQMHGFLFAAPDGTPCTPYMSWQDTRCLQSDGQGGTWMSRLASRLPDSAMDCAGLRLKAGLPLCNAYALLSSGKTVQPGTLFCTLGSYLILRLTGEHACHMTNGGATGCMDVRRRVWNEPVVQTAGLGGLVFPRLLPATEPCGVYVSQGVRVPVYPDVGDQQMAVLGSLMAPVEDVNLNIATAAQMARISPEFTTGEYETRPFFYGTYLNTVTRLPAGRNIEVLVRFMENVGDTLFGVQAPRSALFDAIAGQVALAQQAADSTVPALRVHTGFYRDMLDSTGEGGSIAGISEANLSTGALFLGAYVDMAETCARHFGSLQNRIPVRRLVATGSVALKENTLLKLVSARLGLPVVSSPVSDEVLLGHYRLFLLDAGLCGTLEETALTAAAHLDTLCPEAAA